MLSEPILDSSTAKEREFYFHWRGGVFVVFSTSAFEKFWKNKIFKYNNIILFTKYIIIWRFLHAQWTDSGF